MDIIKIEDLYFEYPGQGEETSGDGRTLRPRQPAALDGVSLSIAKGEFVAVLGHNGSGKSTLAKHINALLLPTSGVVRVKDFDTRDEASVWNIRQSAGMVFQNPDNQLVAAIIEEDVAFGPENMGIPPPEIRRRVDWALKTVGMADYADHSPSQLSGGQKQRVAIAGVLAMKPDCIVLDEPTAMLDPGGRKEVLDTILDLNKREGITIVLITHFMEEAVKADRVVVMENGAIVMEGSPRGVFAQVEKLKGMGLDVPQVTEVCYYLNKEGLDIPADLLSIEEMVDALCQLK
ncbi:MAG: energy-coupling factor transporter ATPase [Clostridiales bacterium]|jgi:energy-coupling factor transport system ATP-binding protein|nr:energy-coupling factor transporter ATPase [Clostridiales bacterium]